MESETPEALLSRFSDFVAQTMGWDFPPSRHAELRRGIAAAAKELGFDSAGDCAHWCMSRTLGKEQIEKLASHLTVGETYFFRDTRTFESLTRHILPSILQSVHGDQRRLRIWSAGCCTGEEPYSIAILLRRMLPDWEQWKITILATDINSQFLRKAEAGIFGKWSFRGAPDALKEQYFTCRPDGKFEILPKIRQMVRFAQLNLADDDYSSVLADCGAMDVILCRNVLLYFSATHAKKVIQKLYQAQADRGWLIVSASEMPHLTFAPYFATNVEGAILHRRENDRLQPTAHEAPMLGLDPQNDQLDVGYIETFEPAEEPPARVADESVELPTESPVNSALHCEARSLANHGDLSAALGCCDRWIAADKLNPASYYLRSVVLQEQGQILQAAQSLRQALYLDPDHVLAHFALGNIARRLNQLHEFRKHLRNALRLLRTYPPQSILPESDGVTAARLAEIIGSLTETEVAA